MFSFKANHHKSNLEKKSGVYVRHTVLLCSTGRIIKNRINSFWKRVEICNKTVQKHFALRLSR